MQSVAITEISSPLFSVDHSESPIREADCCGLRRASIVQEEEALQAAICGVSSHKRRQISEEVDLAKTAIFPGLPLESIDLPQPQLRSDDGMRVQLFFLLLS